MISIHINGLDNVQQMLDRLAKQDVPKATALILNDLATKVADSTKELMVSRFDRPTPWTLGSFKVVKATQSNLVAKVDYNRRRNFMQTQVDGGPRGRKSGESLLMNKGLMTADQMYVPRYGARLDDYGNMSRGQISQIMSFFRAYTGKNARNNRAAGAASLRSGMQFFAITQPGHGLKMGIYQRVLSGTQSAAISKTATSTRALKRAVKSASKRGALPVMSFNPRKSYNKRLPFYENARHVIQRESVASAAWALRMVLK